MPSAASALACNVYCYLRPSHRALEAMAVAHDLGHSLRHPKVHSHMGKLYLIFIGTYRSAGRNETSSHLVKLAQAA